MATGFVATPDRDRTRHLRSPSRLWRGHGLVKPVRADQGTNPPRDVCTCAKDTCTPHRSVVIRIPQRVPNESDITPARLQQIPLPAAIQRIIKPHPHCITERMRALRAQPFSQLLQMTHLRLVTIPQDIAEHSEKRQP